MRVIFGEDDDVEVMDTELKRGYMNEERTRPKGPKNKWGIIITSILLCFVLMLAVIYLVHPVR